MKNLELLNAIKDDPKALYDFTLSLINTVDNLGEKTIELETEIELLNEKLSLFKHKTYGKKSEQMGEGKEYNLFTHENYEHFNEAEANCDTSINKPIDKVTGKVRKPKGKNFVNNVDLEVEEKHYTIDDLTCSKCMGQLEHIGQKENYSLKAIPAKLVKVRNIQHTYKCSCCEENTIITAPKKNPFVKTMVEPSFVANILYKKYFLSIPLYRQEKEFKQLGLDIKRNNLSNWFIAGANLLGYLYNIIHNDIIKSDIAHADETTVTVINKKNKDNTTGYMWLLRSCKYDVPISLYFYKDSREHIHAKDILTGFKGYLHTDCYEAYFKLDNVVNVACIAHLRRKLIEAQTANKSNKVKGTITYKALSLINTLYRIEHRIDKEIKEKNLNQTEAFALIYEERERKCNRVFKRLKDGYNKYVNEILPNSKLGQAFTYFDNNYEYLINYILDPRLAIDNNLCERAAKSFAIGRKNFMFCFSECGAESSAIAYSLVETAIANDLNVFEYLTYVFENMYDADLKTEDELRQLLPYSKTLPSHVYKKKEFGGE